MNTPTTASPDERLVELRVDNLDDDATPSLYLANFRGEIADAYVYLDEDGTVTTGSAWKFNGTPSYQWHGRTRAWHVPSAVKGAVLLALLNSEEVLDLFERVYLGHEVEWDGRNHVGTLDEDGREACDELERIFGELDDSDCVSVWTNGGWIAESHISDVWPDDLTVEEAAKELRDEAIASDVHLSTWDRMESELLEKLLDAYEAALDDGEAFALSPAQRASVEASDVVDRLAALDARMAEFEN